MEAPGGSTVGSAFSGHVGSVGAGPNQSHSGAHGSQSSGSHSHRASQVSAAISCEVRNAASAAFSSRSIQEGESALSHNVEASSRAQLFDAPPLIRGRLASVGESNYPIPNPPPAEQQHHQGTLPGPSHRSRRRRTAPVNTASEETNERTRENRPQRSIPSNFAVQNSSRGGGVSISQVLEGQNFQPGVEWEVEMPSANFAEQVSPLPGGSSGFQATSGPLPVMGVPLLVTHQSMGASCQEGPSGGERTGQASEQQARSEGRSGPNRLAVAHANPSLPVAAGVAPQEGLPALPNNIHAAMEQAFDANIDAEIGLGATSANGGGQGPSAFAPPPAIGIAQGRMGFPVVPGNPGQPRMIERDQQPEGASLLTGNSGGDMVASVPGAFLADDVISDADTNLSFLRAQHNQGRGHSSQARQGGGQAEPRRIESNRSQRPQPANTSHTMVGSVGGVRGNNRGAANDNNSFQSCDTSTVNMSSKNEQQGSEEVEDTARSGNSSDNGGRSGSKSPKSVTARRQPLSSAVGLNSVEGNDEVGQESSGRFNENEVEGGLGCSQDMIQSASGGGGLASKDGGEESQSPRRKSRKRKNQSSFVSGPSQRSKHC
ncbi:hypothetical protein BSKO_12847 [Bryopsis sp. KO-2023]|nr:hypothetical protein BSKO_12847 [Bryopsis sp. KO-2023]